MSIPSSMMVDPITGPIVGGVLLGLVVLFGGFIVIRLIRRRRRQERRKTDPELAEKAAEGVQVGAERSGASSTSANVEDRTVLDEAAHRVDDPLPKADEAAPRSPEDAKLEKTETQEQNKDVV